MEHTPTTTVSKSSLYELYQNHTSDHVDTDECTLQIINILGGIDSVLTQFLSENNQIHISQDQLNRLSNLFITPDRQNSALSKMKSDDKGSAREIFNKNDDICHTFDINETYLHSIFNHKIASILINMMHQNTIHFIWLFSIIIWFVFRIGFIGSIMYPVYTFCVTPLWIIYTWIWLFSVNTKAFKLVIRTFEWWFKFINVFIAAIFYFINQYHFYNGVDYDYYEIRLIGEILLQSTAIFLIMILSSFDALHINHYSKIILSVITATTFTLVVINLLYTIYIVGYHPIIETNIGYDISLTSFSLNAYQMLAIFFWKQTVLTILDKNRCVLIKYRPYICWNDASDINPTSNVVNSSIASNIDRNIQNSLDEYEIKTTSKHIENRDNTMDMIQVNDLNINCIYSNSNESVTMESSISSVHL